MRACSNGAELLDVDADREGADAHLAPVPVHDLTRVVDLRFEKPLAATEEVAGVLLGMEADEVGAEQSFEHLPPPGQHAEHLFGGERDVEEERDGSVALAAAPLADLLRQQAEVVVVHPHDVARLRLLHDDVGEALVDRLVLTPLLLVEAAAVDEVVAQRPERAVGEAVVVALHLFLGERHLAQRELRPLTGHLEAPRVLYAALPRLGLRLPGDPHAARVAHHRVERGDEAAGRAFEADALRRALAHVGLAVGDEEQSPVAEQAAREPMLRARLWRHAGLENPSRPRV